MVESIPKGTRQLLNALSTTNFIITGSLALKLQGTLNRPIKDIDLITNDQRVLDIMRTRGLEVSEAYPNPKHYRFHFKDILSVDVFYENHTPYEIVQLGNKLLKVTPEWYIYHNKLTNRFNNKKKSIKDIVYYFDKMGKEWQGDYM